MKMNTLHFRNNKLIALVTTCLIACICGMASCSHTRDKAQDGQSKNPDTEASNQAATAYDPLRGEGKYDAVELGEKLDVDLSKRGKIIADLKCASCHRYSAEKLVGPGWAGVTKKHRPEWILNFISNPDPMIDKDPELQAQLAECLLRMPNQNLTDDDAREVLEFMRENDGLR